MSKVIEVEHCNECPFASEMKSVCLHPLYVKSVTSKTELLPIPKTGIADFCPLEDSEDFAESNFNIDREGY